MDPATNSFTYYPKTDFSNQDSEKLKKQEKSIDLSALTLDQPKTLTRERLIAEKYRHLPGSAKYCEIDAALRNSSIPFYTDYDSLKKYSLINGGLLGGGNYVGGGGRQADSVHVTFKDRSSITIKKQSSGQLIAECARKNTSTFISVENIVINGKAVNEMTESDRSQVIPLFQDIDSTLEGCYDEVKNTFFITSRPIIKMIEGIEKSDLERDMIKQYSIIESLDDDYVNCALISDNSSELKTKTDQFIQKYEGMLEISQWEEECIDIMIRKATLDGLKINLISSYRYDLLMKESAKVIKQFESIEREIKLLNLSLDTKEALDFHMYRGFVYSKFPAEMYPEQRKIALSDAMITIYCVEEYIKTQRFTPTPTFYKKMAHAFNVFAGGVDNPPVSLKFVTLGLHYLDQCQKMMTHSDPNLTTLQQKLEKKKTEFSNSMVKINLDHLHKLDSIPDVQENLTETIEKMEKIDKILFRPFQDSEEINTLVSNLDRSITAYNKLIKEEKDNVQLFRANLRCLFLRNYHNFLTNYQNIETLISTFDQIILEFQKISKSVPSNPLCQAELHGFRGSVLIAYPRSKNTSQYYDQAIQDFNNLSTMELVFHKDLMAFVYMMFGKHMLGYDPISAVQLLREAVKLTNCSTVKSQSQKLLDDFFGVFKPICSSIQFDTTKMIGF